MKLPINDGSRPSRLERARALTGETSGERVSDAWSEAVEAERARTPAFDFVALSARAQRLPELAPTPALPREGGGGLTPAPWWRRWLLLPALVPALAAIVALILVIPGDPNRTKGDHDLGFYLLRGDAVLPGDPGATFQEGDRLQFTYRSTASALVLLSVDGTGQISAYFPAAGEEPVAIVPGERHVLDGSVVLDDAPGPEVFLAFFGDWEASAARAEAEAAWADDGLAGLVALDEAEPDIVRLELRKR